jgi:hypothetical protein
MLIDMSGDKDPGLTADQSMPLGERAIELELLLAGPILISRKRAVARVRRVDAIDLRGFGVWREDRQKVDARRGKLAADDTCFDAGKDCDVVPSLRRLGESARKAALQMVGDGDDPEMLGELIEEGICAPRASELGWIVDCLIAGATAPIVAVGRMNVERSGNEEGAPRQLMLRGYLARRRLLPPSNYLALPDVYSREQGQGLGEEPNGDSRRQFGMQSTTSPAVELIPRGRVGTSVARLRHGLDVRRELSVQQRVHREAAWLGGELDLVGVEAQARLHVRARDCKDRPAGHLPRDRAVDMAGDDSPHLRMTPQDLTERASIGGRQAELVPDRGSGRDGRMVERNQRHSIRRGCQLGVEPAQPVGIQLARILARSRAVEDHEPQGPEIHRVLHRRPRCSGQVEMPAERVTVVVVSGHDVDGRAELLDQLTHGLVLAAGTIVREVA